MAEHKLWPVGITSHDPDEGSADESFSVMQREADQNVALVIRLGADVHDMEMRRQTAYRLYQTLHAFFEVVEVVGKLTAN